MTMAVTRRKDNFICLSVCLPVGLFVCLSFYLLLYSLDPQEFRGRQAKSAASVYNYPTLSIFHNLDGIDQNDPLRCIMYP